MGFLSSKSSKEQNKVKALPSVQESFEEALFCSDYIAAEEALKQGANTERPITKDTNTYETALFLSAPVKNDAPMIKLLLRYGANVNALGEDGKTPLSRSTVNRDYYGYQMVLAQAEDLNLTFSQTDLALSYAGKRAPYCKGYKRMHNMLEARIRAAQGPWVKKGANKIQHISVDADDMMEFSEIFNFQSAKQTSILRDLKTNKTEITHCFFDDLPANSLRFVKDALEQLEQKGGAQDIDKRFLANRPQRQVQRRSHS